ncbi:MAG: hypothetical protein II449_00350 [Prevotella sp.]|nr:hypothetical protein [Prevotella sp.]
MSKSSKIRWRERDTQQLAKKVKNFNAKLTRLEKKNPALKEILPDRVSVKDLRGDITNRQEYNRVIKALSAFTEKGAEEVVSGKSGVTTTKWQLQQVKKAVAIENRRRKKQADTLKTAPVTIGGKVYTNVRRMAGMQALQPLQVRLDTRTQTSWENFSKYMERQMLGGGQADEQRYFQACVSCWSGMCSDQQVTLLKTHMQQVGIGKCLKAYYNGVDELRPEYIYDAVYTYKLSVSMAVQNVINSINAIAGLPQLDPARFARHAGRNFKAAPRTKYKMNSEE